MRWAFWTIGVIAALSTAGCGRRGSETAGTPQGDSIIRGEQEPPMQGQYDTGMRRNTGAMPADTGRDTRRSARDSAGGNQTESGVTDKSGKSTLGGGVTKTRPDQDQPVTSKGDTIRQPNEPPRR
jgi:hypothetical protein